MHIDLLHGLARAVGPGWVWVQGLVCGALLVREWRAGCSCSPGGEASAGRSLSSRSTVGSGHTALEIVGTTVTVCGVRVGVSIYLNYLESFLVCRVSLRLSGMCHVWRRGVAGVASPSTPRSQARGLCVSGRDIKTVSEEQALNLGLHARRVSPVQNHKI